MMSHADIDFSDKEGIIMWGEIFNGREPNCILMQSTGLCDRKGNELWEGDIVESYDFFGKQLGRYKIVWGHFGFSMQDPAQPEAYNYVALELIERVGNVWENPELLV